MSAKGHKRTYNRFVSEYVTAQLARQELPFSAEQINEIISYRAHTRHFREVAADQEPQIALGQAFAKRNLHEAPIIGCHETWEERDAVARPCRRSLRGLTGGAK
jgi:hypothetical protein